MAFMQVPQDRFHSPWVQILSNGIKALELCLALEKNNAIFFKCA